MDTNVLVELGGFDKGFFESIPGHEATRVEGNGFFHTILVNGEKAGTVGYLAGSTAKNVYFVQVAIAQKYRGQGLVQKAEDLLARTYKIPVLTATIDSNNLPSLRAHLKAGFKELEPEKLNLLRKQGFLKKGQTRLIKIYSLKV